jgi:hypothetical protein
LIRAVALTASGIGTLFWLYTFYAISQVPPGDGTGMQWVAVMPLGFIFLALTLPALLLALRGRSLTISAVIGVLGLLAFAYIWPQLLAEFAVP